MKIVSRNNILRELEAFCDRFATFNDAAEKLGVTPAQLSAARRNPDYPVPQRILDKLGYATATVYVGKADAPKKPVKAKKAKPVAKPKAKAKPVAKPKAKPITKADLIDSRIKVKAAPKPAAPKPNGGRTGAGVAAGTNTPPNPTPAPRKAVSSSSESEKTVNVAASSNGVFE